MRCAARLCVLIEENRMEAANKIAIITDTCCDLPQEYLKEFFIDFSETTGIKKQILHNFSNIKEAEIVKIETAYTLYMQVRYAEKSKIRQPINT